MKITKPDYIEREFLRYKLMDNLHHAQDNLRSVWVDSLYLGSPDQREAISWVLKEGCAEEFRVNGRARLLLTSLGRRYIEAKYKNFARILMALGV